jgi:hypothetical protein
MKSRMIATALGAAVMLVTSIASAEEQCDTGATSVAIEAQADAPAADAGCDVAAANSSSGPAALENAPDFELLTDDELAVLTEAAAKNPELEEKAGGYVSNEQLVGILLVVLIVVLVL